NSVQRVHEGSNSRSHEFGYKGSTIQHYKVALKNMDNVQILSLTIRSCKMNAHCDRGVNMIKC
ncbi:hypothetical protein HAX54_023898, partial [Datura stramonium]|nr:hypothetical protein [Datura stramonium]